MRRCSLCGGSRYYRRMLVKGWDRWNVGSRRGWHQTKVVVGDCCGSNEQTQRVLSVSRIHAVTAMRRRRAR
jgi:hypothetical protein